MDRYDLVLQGPPESQTVLLWVRRPGVGLATIQVPEVPPENISATIAKAFADAKAALDGRHIPAPMGG